ncbi:hypothetical protein JVU11DRAFT_7446 [Chiua virens]|nr:hypothetical protein JVU11DRAFT_7446 [Chiua virens]
MAESAVFDIIFVGAGTAACVIAGRLAAADPSLKILVIERGEHTRDVPNVVQPSRFVEHLAPNSTSFSHHAGKPSKHLDGRAPVVSCVRAVGGGSAVNFMVYVRGAASDYDDWARKVNMNIAVPPRGKRLNYYDSSETFNPMPGRPTHGYSGPIEVSAGGTNLGIGNQFLQVGKVYDPECPQVDDHMDFKTPNAYSPAYMCVDVTGKRSDAASRYLYPHSDNPNVKIVVGKRVKRVIIENGCAVGVEYTLEVAPDPSDPSPDKELITAKGDSDGCSLCRDVWISNYFGKVRDCVGENYQDHYGAFSMYHVPDDTDTMDDVWGDPEADAGWLKEWKAHGTGKIAHNGIEAMMKVRLTAAQVASTAPTLQSRWETFFKHHPDKSMAIIQPLAGFPLPAYYPMLAGQKLLMMTHYILYPESIGSVHIASGEDAHAPFDFDPNICSKPGDVAQLTLFYKMSRERARRMSAYRGEVAASHPQFPEGNPAACREAAGPVSMDAPDIVYSEADDAAIVKFHLEKVTPTFHSLGTCAMKPRQEGGVVDSRLNVYGVKGLKVADLSICPTNVGNNTYSTALLIGEKAAIIIAQDLGIELREA